MDNKLWQEFFCNDCDGHFRVKLNMALNIRVEMVCPNCGRKHPRALKDGRIIESHGDGSSSYVEEIIVPKSAYSKEPFTSKIKPNARDGAVIDSAEHIRDVTMWQMWLEHFGGKS